MLPLEVGRLPLNGYCFFGFGILHGVHYLQIHVEHRAKTLKPKCNVASCFIRGKTSAPFLGEWQVTSVRKYSF